MPEPYKSKFGAVQWRDRYKGTTRVYDWAIKGLIPRGKSVLIYGESQSGKSFETYDMCMAIARGEPFAGRKTQQLGVIYCAAEKGEGFLSRMHAYDKHHNLPRDDDLPFAVLTKSLDLWSADQTTDILIQEIVELSKDWSFPLGVVALDTYQAATPGASIIKDEDITTMYKRAQRIMEKTGAGVWFVHHKNAHGTIRGSLVLWNAIETTIEIGNGAIPAMCKMMITA
jgi:RecA-family ATPase